MNQRQPETKVIEKTDLLDRIIEETRDVGVSYNHTGGLEANSFTGLCTLAKLIFESGAAPKSMDSSKKVLIAIAYGQTIGLNIWQSMKAIYIVNGMPSLWGRTVLALCRQNPEWDESGFDEYWEIQGKRQDSHPAKFDDDTITAVCQTLRKGASKPMVRKFSVADAKRAGLWGASGKLYGPYPQRLLPARALGYCLDDNFGDSLKGIQIRETFDEEVDGKRNEVNNADELRDMLEKKQQKQKTEPYQTGHLLRDAAKNSAPAVKTKAASSAPDAGPVLRLDFDPNQGAAIVPEPMSELEISRDWLKKVYAQIPLKANPMEMLKQASMNGYKWLQFEDIENCENVGWLNETAAKLEDMIATVKTAKS